MDEVGIYRLSGIASEIQQLKKLFNERMYFLFYWFYWFNILLLLLFAIYKNIIFVNDGF